MKKDCIHFLEKPKLRSLFLFLFLLGPFFSHAQITDLAAGTDWQRISYNGTYQDFKIPDDFVGVIYFRMFGGDGGFADAQEDGSCLFKGGAGAEVYQELIVGDGDNEIPAGTTIRFIIGGKGESQGTNGGTAIVWYAGGGGGGTGILAQFYEPNQGNYWLILSAAGGGGGGYAKVFLGCSGESSHGGSGVTTRNGENVDDHEGGVHGSGGECSTDKKSGSGGGAFTDGYGAKDEEDVGKAGWVGFGGGGPLGGKGGTSSQDAAKKGGFGFGGGGVGHEAGGGGGGYSGGAADSYGGGGGSYVEEHYSVNHYLKEHPTTSDVKDGFVLYRLEWKCRIGNTSVTIDEAESCAGEGATVTATIESTPPCATDLYYDLKDASNPDDLQFVTSSNDGVFENVSVGQYAIVVGNVAYGSMDTVTFAVNVAGDISYPIALCKDITVTLDENGTYILNPEEVDDGSTDDCGIDEFFLLGAGGIGLSQQTLSCDQVGDPNFEVGLAVRDYADLTSICIAQVTVKDGTSPSLPDNMLIEVYLDASGQYSLKQGDISHIEATDICDDELDLSYTIDDESATYTCADIGQTVTTKLTVSDPAGNTTVGEMVITVLDPIRPTITCQDVTIELGAAGTANIDYVDFIVSASDNCLSEAEIISGYSWNTNLLPSTVDCDDIGTHQVDLLRSTVAHETDLPPCTATLTIVDQLAPTLICEDITVVLNDQGFTNITDEELPITYSDNCTPQQDIIINRIDYTFTCNNIEDDNLEVDVTAIDQFNNSSSCSFKVTVVDDPTPTVRCKDSRKLMNRAGPSLNITVNDVLDGVGSPCAADVLGSVEFAAGTQITYTCEDIDQDNFVTLIFTPDNGAATSSCTARITPYEDDAPIMNCPGLIQGGLRRVQVNAQAGLCGGAVYNFDLNPTDNCGVTSIIQDQGLPSGATYPYGETLNSITLTDASGNSNNCTFVVEVINAETPTVNCPNDLSIDLEGESCGIILEPFPIPTVLDDCSSITISHTNGPLPGEELSAGTYYIRYDISNHGSSTYCNTIVQINDKVAPVAKCTTAINTYTFNSNNTLRPNVSWVDDGSYDPCDGTISRKVYPTALKCHQMGEQVLTMVIYDAQQNRSECQSTVMILPAPPQCQDISVQLEASGEASISSDDIFIGTDNACGTNLTLSQLDFNCSDIGANEVILTLTTEDGFTSSCTSTVTIEDDALSPICQQSVLLSATALLEGPYEVASGLMNDALRIQDLIPLNSPYAGTTESINSNVLTTTGNNAIVDWILVQLRSEVDNTEVLYQRAALLQRDGDIVDVDGNSPVSFDEATEGNYYVVVKHRNHMGCISSSTFALSSTATYLDFTSSSMPVYGSNSRTELKSGVWGLYGADVDGSGNINASDRSMTWNDRNKTGYLNSDCNLDGATNANDRSAAWNNRNLGGTMPD